MLLKCCLLHRGIALSGHDCQKFGLSVLLSFCLIFCKFQPGVACKSVAYEKMCIVILVVEMFQLKQTTRMKQPQFLRV